MDPPPRLEAGPAVTPLAGEESPFRMKRICRSATSAWGNEGGSLDTPAFRTPFIRVARRHAAAARRCCWRRRTIHNAATDRWDTKGPRLGPFRLRCSERLIVDFAVVFIGA